MSDACQHDLKKPDSTIVVVTGYSGQCEECGEYVALDIPGDTD